MGRSLKNRLQKLEAYTRPPEKPKYSGCESLEEAQAEVDRVILKAFDGRERTEEELKGLMREIHGLRGSYQGGWLLLGFCPRPLRVPQHFAAQYVNLVYEYLYGLGVLPHSVGSLEHP